MKKFLISLCLCIVHFFVIFLIIANCCAEIIWHYDWSHERDFVILLVVFCVIFVLYRLCLRARNENLIYSRILEILAVSNFITAISILIIMSWLACKDGIDLRFYDIVLMQIGVLYIGWKYMQARKTPLDVQKMAGKHS